MDRQTDSVVKDSHTGTDTQIDRQVDTAAKDTGTGTGTGTKQYTPSNGGRVSLFDTNTVTRLMADASNAHDSDS